jgi:Pyruvate/2-oxoacid:ferredoxin oxidoreductase delta subunit
MHNDVYRRLAQVLDDLPNKFPPTESGVEFSLLAKLFTEEEAALACVMRLVPEPVADIALRAGTDPKETRNTLKRMMAKGLIDIRKGEVEFSYALRPFVVGFYEGQLPRMDAEMAELFEKYFRESKGGVLRESPALHRVIPVEKAVPVEINIHPYERASQMLEGAKSWGVRDCICRVQQHLLGKNCGHPVETCLVFSHVEHAFDRSKVDRALTKEEALKILQQTEEAGLVHSSGNYRDGIEYICNCCICCCGIMRGIAEFGIMSAVAHSDFQIVVQGDACNGCEACVGRCQFEALTVSEGLAGANYLRCVGCGLCVLVCPTDALHLERRREGADSVPPKDIVAWRDQRVANRRSGS